MEVTVVEGDLLDQEVFSIIEVKRRKCGDCVIAVHACRKQQDSLTLARQSAIQSAHLPTDFGKTSDSVNFSLGFVWHCW